MYLTKNDIEAQIYNLSGLILMGKASKDEIKKVTELAIKHNLRSLLKQEFLDVSKKLLK